MPTKLIIFDLDGVLIDSREDHFHALNDALMTIDPRFVISRDEHLSRFDGLPTNTKLELLAQDRGLPRDVFDLVWKKKQEATLLRLAQIQPNPNTTACIDYFRGRGWKIAVASNAIRATVRQSLHSLQILHHIDYVMSNEDVIHAKPYPEIYWQCMTAVKALPQHTLIVEDSHIGRQGAIDSGATLVSVEGVHDLHLDRLIAAADQIEESATTTSPAWRDSRLNVLIPMAGAGSRFAKAGYVFPKPLVEVHGKPMIQVVVENLNIEANYIFLVQKEHYTQYNLKYLLNLLKPNCKIVLVDGLTEGAACTTLLAKEHINTDAPLVIANSDQYIEWNANECLYAFTADGIDGGMLTFKATHPKWSYAKLDEQGFVSEVAEKKPISDNATVGVYYWKRGSDYVKYAEQMIAKNIRTNNEFYVCPVANEAIADGKRIRVKQIGKMWGIGVPEDLHYFLEHHL